MWRVAFLLSLLAFSAAGFAQTYPSKPVRIVVAFVPERLAALMRENVAKFGKIIKTAGIKVD